MEKKEITCICCPMGCQLTVELNGKEVEKIEGNTCKRGIEYAKKEITNPKRIVTSVVEVKNRKDRMVSVKTKEDIPKDKMFECVKCLKGLEINAPIRIGDVILENAGNTGIEFVATKNVD